MTKHAHPHNSADGHGSRLRVVPASTVVETTLPAVAADVMGGAWVFAGPGQVDDGQAVAHRPPRSAADLADSYARQVDELAATVEHCLTQLRVVAGALGELNGVLGEIAGLSRGGRGDA